MFPVLRLKKLYQHLAKSVKEKIQPFENLRITIESGKDQ
jgi:hypothetical protein